MFVGTVTSGNFSPVLGHGIAMAFLSPKHTPGGAVHVDIRGKAVPGEVVKLPFVSKKKQKG
jgi:aminomethyltransferase